MKALKDLFVPVAILLLATGCASASSPFQTMDSSRQATRQQKEKVAKNIAATLQLENDNRSEVTVYLIHLGTRTRLGRVAGMARRTFRVSPQHLHRGNGALQLMVVSSRSPESFTTDPIFLSGGEEIEMVVKAHLQISTYSVGTN